MMRYQTTSIRNFAAALLIWAGCVQLACAQESWANFQNGGKLANADWSLPTEWSPTDGIAWTVKLSGYGQSSPVIFDDLVFVTSVSGKNKETLHVQAIDLAQGQTLWSRQSSNSSPEENSPNVSRAAPSPVADADGVIAFFEGGDLIAYDRKGDVRWQRDLVEEFGEIKARHGLSASLEQDDSHVFVWVERTESPYVLAVAKADGKTTWKRGGLGATSWGSPRMISVKQNRQLVLSAIGLLAGLDPATGDRLWEFHDVLGNSSSTPIPAGDGKFLIGSSKSVPSNGLIEITRNPAASDDDNALPFVANWVWRAKKAKCSFGSPLVANDRAYFVNRSGIVNCLDLQTGDSVFADRLPSNSMWATPLATKQHIYFFGKDGLTAVIKPGKQLEIVAKNWLWEEGVATKSDQHDGGAEASGRTASPVLYANAVSRSKLILRRGDMLYAVQSAGELK